MQQNLGSDLVLSKLPVIAQQNGKIIIQFREREKKLSKYTKRIIALNFKHDLNWVLGKVVVVDKKQSENIDIKKCTPGLESVCEPSCKRSITWCYYILSMKTALLEKSKSENSQRQSQNRECAADIADE